MKIKLTVETPDRILSEQLIINEWDTCTKDEFDEAIEECRQRLRESLYGCPVCFQRYLDHGAID